MDITLSIEIRYSPDGWCYRATFHRPRKHATGWQQLISFHKYINIGGAAVSEFVCTGCWLADDTSSRLACCHILHLKYKIPARRRWMERWCSFPGFLYSLLNTTKPHPHGHSCCKLEVDLPWSNSFNLSVILTLNIAYQGSQVAMDTQPSESLVEHVRAPVTAEIQ